MSIRFTLIRYRSPDGTASVGSGLLVASRTVLTCDHVANGTDHRAVFHGREILVDRKVRSETTDVDLAVLILAADPPGVAITERMPFAGVDHSGEVPITNCSAVGFPRGNRDERGRASAQVFGFIRPGDQERPSGGPAGGEWLELVREQTSWGPPTLTDLGDSSENPWFGMSGAVVVRRGTIIGVIRSYSVGRDPRTLTVTPVTALARLSADKQRQFCEVLGLANVHSLPVVTGDDSPVQPRPPYPPTARSVVPGAAFSAEIRDRYRGTLSAAGLAVPDRWDEASLDRLRLAHQGHDSTTDLLEALSMAVGALPLLEQLDGRMISIATLNYLYLRHVGRRPECANREEMLIHAASASIAERRGIAGSPIPQPRRLAPLARFMLAIAGHWKGPEAATLDDPDLGDLATWLTGPLLQQREDAEAYLADEVGGRTWAVIELEAGDRAERARPTAVLVDTFSEDGAWVPQRCPCDTSAEISPEDAVLAALRDAVAPLADKEDVLVDLVLPRHWLDAGIEQWKVVPAGDRYESLSENYSPWLRWVKHRHEPRLRARFRQRFRAVDWTIVPEAIPVSTSGDPVRFQDWLHDRDQDGVRYPPYFSGITPAEADHDPFGDLLQAGYGFTVWFPPEASQDACDDAVYAAAGPAGAPDPGNDLPRRLAMKLRAHKPVIVWSTPDGREDFKLPAPRGGGTRRGGSR